MVDGRHLENRHDVGSHCLFFHNDFNLPSTLLALPILLWQSVATTVTCHIAAQIANFIIRLDCSISYLDFCVINPII